jgi:ferredoxin
MKIDEESCIGCGLCATLYPELFEIGTDGHSHIKKNVHIASETLQKIIKECPASAIFEEKE